MEIIHSELDGVPCDYQIMEKLGEGGFSKVFKCKRIMNGKSDIYAVKVFSRSFLKMQKTWSQVNNRMVVSTALEKVEREIALMKRLRHPYLVRMIDVIDDEEKDQIYMVIEFVENGQIMYYDPAKQTFSNRETLGILSEEKAKKYLYDIILGLQYLHLHKVVHRDIKPENILISKDDHCKISILYFIYHLHNNYIVDFGVAHIFDTLQSNETEDPNALPVSNRPLNLLTRTNTGLMTNTAGTTYFYSPECCNDEPYNSYAVDIWALGVTLFAMVVGRLPLFNPDYIAFMDDLLEKEIVIPSHLSPYLRYPYPYQSINQSVDLLSRFLEKNPAKRISIDEILSHPWLQEYSDVGDIITSPRIDRDNLSTQEVRHALSLRITSPIAFTAEHVAMDVIVEDKESKRDKEEEEDMVKDKELDAIHAEELMKKKYESQDNNSSSDCCCVY